VDDQRRGSQSGGDRATAVAGGNNMIEFIAYCIVTITAMMLLAMWVVRRVREDIERELNHQQSARDILTRKRYEIGE
jgi:hypothetical protein